MGAVTYPDAKVVSFIAENMIPLQVLYDAEPLAKQFGVKWTPTIVTLDPKGLEHHRTVGFLAPEDLIPSLHLGIAKAHFDRDAFAEALTWLDGLLKEYPKSDSAPEALFVRGVSLYKKNRDTNFLKAAYLNLTAEFPNSEWAKRAAPYRLL